jgi:1-acyl-sn-glycerol-3-phosphate acyltransferase
MATAKSRDGQRSNGTGAHTQERDAATKTESREAAGDQAARFAEQAARKADERREKADGAAGWVAERAGEWTLDGPDYDFMRRQQYFWNPLVDYWFRMEMEGWENIPSAPVLLVGVHSGAPFVWDAWTVGIQWWRRFGDARPLHGTAHDALMAAPLIGKYFRKMGVLPAAPDSIAGALAAGHDVALWPGGEIDSLRPWTERDKAVLAGRTGFVKMAIRAGVPIVPIATVGGPDSMPVLTRGRGLAKALKIDKVARLKILPISLSVPWGINLAMLPEIPLPTKIRTSFQEPIEVDTDPDRAGDDDYVQAKYDEVQASIQSGMEKLARHRRFPLFG